MPDAFTDIAPALRRTFDDHRLSRTERRALSEVLGELCDTEDKLRFVRNRAFEIAREVIDTHEHRQALEWLEEVIGVVDSSRADTGPGGVGHAEAYFSPGDACRDAIIGQFRATRKSADVCVYTITDNRIKSALLDAARNGVAVRIITDVEKTRDPGSDIDELHRRGVAVRVDDTTAFMHHKFAIFDRRSLITGSFNWTRGASSGNQENLIVTDSAPLIAQYQETFDQLWRQLDQYRG